MKEFKENYRQTMYVFITSAHILPADSRILIGTSAEVLSPTTIRNAGSCIRNNGRAVQLCQLQECDLHKDKHTYYPKISKQSADYTRCFQLKNNCDCII